MLTANQTTKSWRKNHDATVLSKFQFLFFVSIMKLDYNDTRINFNLPNDASFDYEVTELTETQWSLKH